MIRRVFTFACKAQLPSNPTHTLIRLERPANRRWKPALQCRCSLRFLSLLQRELETGHWGRAVPQGLEVQLDPAVLDRLSVLTVLQGLERPPPLARPASRSDLAAPAV